MTIKNLKQFQARMKKRIDNADKKMARALARSTMIVQAEAQESILSGAKSGRTYMRGGRPHTASAAGEAPANDTGVLAGGITTSVEKEDRNTLVGYVKAHARGGSGGNYAVHLEFGTRTMAARPFMQPSLQKNERKIKQIFMQEGIIDK